MKCGLCGHDMNEHEPIGYADDGREILLCAVRTCRCEVLEGDG